ncbi:hypothetical protein CANINC_002014 [Pichia inconspicua]|uniref:Mitochondrial import inner membrane translocase subunit TIM22 n=1 Tax=Pichia inconspicua TaxID=52247 RepID=A0A4T0X291_9ASCO|nr:hypothetical protein CANINC_002014 [[Candida] inconspicua]
MSTINPDDLDTKNLNAQNNAEHVQEIYSDLRKLHEESYNARLGLPSPARIALFTIGGTAVGGLGGMLSGWTDASLKYLAANSHRLPTSYNGWFFYHKRKTYYCTKNAMGNAFKNGIKIGGFVGIIFSIEALMDKIRGQVDFVNTMTAILLPGFVYAWYNNMSRVQAKELINKGGKIGLLFGLSQDALQYFRGVDVWYLNRWFGIKPMKLSERLRQYADSKKME